MRVNVVISQSMYFPWVGFLEQLRVADVFVRYDDVQFSKGSFTNRVQIKTAAGSRWMTVPLTGLHLGQRIDEVQLSADDSWRARHLGKLAQAYCGAPHRDEMLALVDDVFSTPVNGLADLAFESTRALARYFGLHDSLRWKSITELPTAGASSARVLEVVKAVGGTRYITGHGARNYLDHAAFEAAGIEVHYMRYRCLPYPQLHGDFTPYVSALDLVAQCGRTGQQYIQPETANWRDFLRGI